MNYRYIWEKSTSAVTENLFCGSKKTSLMLLNLKFLMIVTKKELMFLHLDPWQAATISFTMRPCSKDVWLQVNPLNKWLHKMQRKIQSRVPCFWQRNINYLLISIRQIQYLSAMTPLLLRRSVKLWVIGQPMIIPRSTPKTTLPI